jgi:hypothetical protein
MRKRSVFILVMVLTVFLVPFVIADLDSHVQKLTHYAEEYEIGNIDYVKLLVYISSVREKINEEVGVVSRDEGGILRQEQIREILGESDGETRWAWVEGEDRERRLLEPVPTWENNIVFDGRKIQIRLSAWPSIYVFGSYEDEYEERDRRREREDNDYEKEELVYRLNFDIGFKRPEEQLDIEGKIEEIKILAESYNADPLRENAEILARESVNAEKVFESSFKQSSLICTDIMNDIFGSENKRQTQKTLQEEIDYFQGDDVFVTARLNMCDDCDWNWIDVFFELDRRNGGAFEEGFEDDYERFKDYNFVDFEREIRDVFEEIRKSLESGDYEINRFNNELNLLNQAWNEKSNDVWEEVDLLFRDKFDNYEGEDRYYWLKLEQERREKEKEIRYDNYLKRKRFYEELFSGYYKKETYFMEEEWEKRLVEVFRERGEEICDNSVDDNDNGLVDCQDPQCAGELVGEEEVFVGIEDGEGGVVGEEIVELYCIEGEIKSKEKERKKEAVCGNHVIDEGETDKLPEGLLSEELELWKKENNYCPEDFRVCFEYDPIECEEGRLVFSGEDKHGCPLSPVCVEEKCEVDSDCEFLCGVGVCIIGDRGVGECRLREGELIECKEVQCTAGEKAVEKCVNGDKIVTAICGDGGLWIDLFVECPVGKLIEEVCCSEPGSADEPTFRWRNEDECRSPEGSGFPVAIVEDSFCNDKREVLECVKCGNGCISKDELPVVSCFETTEEFECVSKGKEECVRVDFDEGEEEIEEEIEVEGKIKDEEIVGDECTVASDCGGENDVCSNGLCETLPHKVIEDEIVEIEIDLDEFEGGVDEESGVTGNFIFRFFGAIPKITGNVITGSQIDEGEVVVVDPEVVSEEEVEAEPVECPDVPDPDYDRERCTIEEMYDENGCLSGYGVPVCDEGDDYDFENDGEDDNGGEYYEDENYKDGDDEYNEDDYDDRNYCDEDCENMCYDREVVRCVEDCVYIDNSDKLGDLEECKSSCEADTDLSGCVDRCVPRCLEGGNIWEDFDEGDEHKEEKGVFRVGGVCREAEGKKKSIRDREAFLFFDGWGNFDIIHRIKNKYYQREGDWCKKDLENLIKQRVEFEKGFNRDFAKWFLENYLANSAEDWEGHISGIYEIYWNNVENQIQTAERMNCLGKRDITKVYDFNLINFEYDTEYGKIEYWEEFKEVDLDDIGRGFGGKSGGKVTIVSPYMKIYIFPNKEFIKAEMKKAMANHEFPGPPEDRAERHNEEGPTEDEKKYIRKNRKFMKIITDISDKYGGSIDAAVQFKDFETEEVVFNLHAQVNPDIIMRMEPMLPKEVPDKDVTIDVDFDKVYELIEISEEGYRGEEIESPPWDRQVRVGSKIKQVFNGARMFFKVRSLVNDAEVYPKETEKDVRKLVKEFFKMMIKGMGDRGDKENEGGFDGRDGGGFGEEFDEENSGEFSEIDDFYKFKEI